MAGLGTMGCRSRTWVALKRGMCTASAGPALEKGLQSQKMSLASRQAALVMLEMRSLKKFRDLDRFFDELRHQGKATVAHYNLYMQGKRPSQLTKIFQEMLDNEMVPDRFTFGNLVTSLGRNELDRLQEIKALMAEYRVPRNTFFYNKELQMLSQTGDIERALTVMDEMKEKHVAPDEFTYAWIINAYTKADLHDEAFELYEEVSSTSIVRGSILQLYAVVAAISKGDLEHAKKLVFRDSLNDTSVYRSRPADLILRELCIREDSAGISEFKQQLKEQGLSLSGYSYGNLIAYYGERKDMETVNALYAEAKLHRVHRLPYLMNSLIYALSQNGLKERVEFTFESMRQTGPKPTVTTYLVLLSHFIEIGDVDSVEEIVSLLRLRYKRLPLSAAKLLVQMYGAKGAGYVSTLYSQLKRTRTLVDKELYLLMLDVAKHFETPIYEDELRKDWEVLVKNKSEERIAVMTRDGLVLELTHNNDITDARDFLNETGLPAGLDSKKPAGSDETKEIKLYPAGLSIFDVTMMKAARTFNSVVPRVSELPDPEQSNSERAKEAPETQEAPETVSEA
ncbi:hypothetical protein NDN08_001492 [Rhodosorus marinus]|uniref:Pentacotripeptide-repeat region of PRORP domain-containing protein n=1 Tax=Rhodosorus marinus TaxID=101924 RepID=A0AAV8UR10_9RHOD|nr:hypothetical protein NDN08_001492 [Rhodosorus marinus]